MLKAPKKPISSLFQIGHCVCFACGWWHTHTNTRARAHALSTVFIRCQCSSLCTCFYHASVVVTVAFWRPGIQPLIFFWESMRPALLMHVVLLGLTPPETLVFAMVEVWLPRTQWSVKCWTRDPIRANEIPWDFCWDFWDKRAFLLRGEEIWTGNHIASKRKEPNHRKQSEKTEREKPGTGGERETRYSWCHFSPASNQIWSHLTRALQFQEPVTFPIHLNHFGWVFLACDAKNPNDGWIFPECFKLSLLWHQLLKGRAPVLSLYF